MTNTELIDLFRNIERSNHPVCNGCPMKYTCDKNQITRCLFGSAADALEAAYKLIADLKPKEGKWIRIDEYIYDEPWECSNCETTNSCRSRYCPNCGARMKFNNK